MLFKPLFLSELQQTIAFFLFLLLQFTTGNTNAQQYSFFQYQVEQGLSNNTVTCSLQDKNGFLWFGTKDGLNRFDGYQFKTFYPARKNENEANYIICLACDSKGTIWAGSSSGIYRYDKEKEKLIPFLDTLKYVGQIYPDLQGNLWFIADRQLYRYSFVSQKLTNLSSTTRLKGVSFLISDNYIWLGGIDGFLYRIDPVTGTYVSADVFAHSPKPLSTKITKILSDNTGGIFIGTLSQGIKRLDRHTLAYEDLLNNNKNKTSIYVHDILQTDKNEFWFATESGIYVYHVISRKFTRLVKKNLDPYSLSDNAVYTLCKDKENGIWAGTFFGGINYYNRLTSSLFERYFPDNTTHSISGNAIRAITEDPNGNIWIGTEDAGLNQLNAVTKQIKQFKADGKKGSIAFSNIHGLTMAGDNLVVGTYHHGLDVLNIKSGKVIKHFSSGPGKDKLKNDFIICLLYTRRGELYAGTQVGLYKCDLEKGRFQPEASIPYGVSAYCLTEDSKGTVWLGTHGSGVFYFNSITGEKGHLSSDPANENSLTINNINDVFEDSNGNLWFATDGEGLCRLGSDRKKFTKYTTRNGFPSNFVFKVLEYDQKNLWITTSKGLVNFNADLNTLKIYTKADGLLTDQFNYSSGYKDKNGKLYFGTVKGMIAFNPSDLRKSKLLPALYITGFMAANKELAIGPGKNNLSKSILFTDTVTLSYDNATFNIDFAAISYISPQTTRYRYRMVGSQKEWTNLASNRRVYFTNLTPGTYTFWVQAFGNDFSGKTERKLTIIILPPLWATWQAYLFYAAILALLLYYLFHAYRSRQLRKRGQELYNAKMEFFTNITHEIKTPLTLILGPLENLSEMVGEMPKIKDDVTMMERNTGRLIGLIDLISDFRRAEVKSFSLTLSEIDITLKLKEEFDNFKDYAAKKGITYTLELPEHSIYIKYDPEAIQKIFSNLLSNACKYAAATVMVRILPVQKEDKSVIIEFYNDGFLIPRELSEKIFDPFYRIKETANQKGSGIGLSLVRSLVTLHSGRIYHKKSESGTNLFVLELLYNN